MHIEVLFQAFEGSMPICIDQRVKEFLCVQSYDYTGVLHPLLFWLCTDDTGWHRFFIDRINVLHWHKYAALDEADLLDKDFPVLDIGSDHGLNGRIITDLLMRQEEPESGILTITFDSAIAMLFVHSIDQDLENERAEMRIVAV